MPYKRKRKNKIEWVAEVVRQGKRYYKLFTTKNEALAWEADIRKAPVEELLTPIVSSTLLDWANAYLEFSESRFVRKVFTEKQTVFRRLFKVIPSTTAVSTLKPWHVLQHLQTQAKCRSGHAANKDRKNLVAGWNWGQKYMNLPGPNPCLVETFPEERQARYIPSQEDFWKAYELTEGQDQTMLLAYLHLAARKSELFRLLWEDVDFYTSRVRLSTRKRKGGNLEHDWLPMTEELYQALLAHKEGAYSEIVFPDSETGLAFTSRQHFMKRLCRRAGVKPFCFHALRHLTASILAQSDVPMVTIQAILRHKNLTTTERYIRGLEPVRPALELLSNRKSRPRVPTTSEGEENKKLRAV